MPMVAIPTSTNSSNNRRVSGTIPKREALLHRIQQLTIERVMFAPIMDLRGLIGVGPRLAEHTINSIPVHPFPAFEDITLKE